ncbi:MAG: nucleotidyltransferase family protein, partial [Nitrospirae bacterium]|nr:nucleotidyltransferase family protein [Nitrospirota bacterium]
MNDILKQGVDWNLVLKAAGRHRILSILYYHLKDSDNAEVPSWIKKEMEKCYHITAYRNLVMYSLLQRILKGCEEKSIAVVLLKGVALTEKIYGNIGIRPMYDIDLLVKKEDLEKVDHFLGTLNCFPAAIQEGNKSCNYHYQHQSGPVIVEVHWNLENTPNPFAL